MGQVFAPRGSARGGRVCASWSRAARRDARRRQPLRSASSHLARDPRQSRSSARATLTCARRPLCPTLTRASASLDDPSSLPLPLHPPPPLSPSESRVNRVCVNVEGSGTKRSVEDRSVDSRNSRRKLIRRDELKTEAEPKGLGRRDFRFLRRSKKEGVGWCGRKIRNSTNFSCAIFHGRGDKNIIRIL